MLKKNLIKACIFSSLFSLINVFYNDGLYANNLYNKNHYNKIEHINIKKNNHLKRKCHIKKYKNECQFDKYKKYFIGFGFADGLSYNSNQNITFDEISKDDFEPAASSDFIGLEFKGKLDYSFNQSLNFGYWVKNNVALGVDIDYLFSKHKQSDFETSGLIESQLASASLFGQFFFNIKDIVSPYLQFGFGFGRSFTKAVITIPELASITPSVIGNSLFIDNLNKNVGLFKLGAGLSKECKNSVIGFGYQFIKTTKIDDIGSSTPKVKFSGGVLEYSDFKFSNLAKSNHLINFFVKASF
jgi:hypothetical protein